MNKWDLAHMRVAYEYAKLSSAVRLQVGAVIVKRNTVLSFGYNGTPSGWDNCCETEEYVDDEMIDHDDVDRLYPFVDEDGYRYKLVTKPEVLHAETNAIAKLAREGGAGAIGATLYVTTEPCINCAKLTYQSGIERVVYNKPHLRSAGVGVDFLKQCGVKVEQIEDSLLGE